MKQLFTVFACALLSVAAFAAKPKPTFDELVAKVAAGTKEELDEFKRITVWSGPIHKFAQNDTYIEIHLQKVADLDSGRSRFFLKVYTERSAWAFFKQAWSSQSEPLEIKEEWRIVRNAAVVAEAYSIALTEELIQTPDFKVKLYGDGGLTIIVHPPTHYVCGCLSIAKP